MISQSKPKFLNQFYKITKPMNYIFEILSIASYKVSNKSPNRIMCAYGKLTLLIIVVLSSLIVKTYCSYSKFKIHITSQILDIILTTIKLAIVITSITNGNTKYLQSLSKFFINIKTISNNTSFSQNHYSNTQLKLFFKCLLVNCGIMGIVAVDIWNNMILTGLMVTLCELCNYWLFYYEFIIFLQIEIEIGLINEMFLYLNKNLIKNSLEFNTTVDAIVDMQTKGNIKLGETAITHYLLCEQIKIINKMHGTQMLGLIATLIISILNFIDKVIILAQDKDNKTKDFNYITIFTLMSWNISLLVHQTYIFKLCFKIIFL